jgi:hypothetical protein
MEEVTSYNKNKYHFFIGNIFKDENQILLLKKIQQKIKERYKLKNFFWNTKFCTKFIYLGYLDIETAKKYMNNVFNALLTAISDKFSVFNCNYNKYRLHYDGVYYKISLDYSDAENYLNNIILPYLNQNGILPVYESRKNVQHSSIDLIYFKDSPIIQTPRNEDKITIMIPDSKFTIDHLSLIRGIPIHSKVGHQSLHDQMNYEEVSRYIYPLQKEVQEFVFNNNLHHKIDNTNDDQALNQNNIRNRSNIRNNRSNRSNIRSNRNKIHGIQ